MKNPLHVCDIAQFLIALRYLSFANSIYNGNAACETQLIKMHDDSNAAAGRQTSCHSSHGLGAFILKKIYICVYIFLVEIPNFT